MKTTKSPLSITRVIVRTGVSAGSSPRTTAGGGSTSHVVTTTC